MKTKGQREYVLLRQSDFAQLAMSDTAQKWEQNGR